MVKLSKEVKAKIIECIRLAESGTTGEIRVHLKSSCKSDALKEAKIIFKKLGMQNTMHRNATLIFVSPGSRVFSVIGDEGIHQKVGAGFWDSTRDTMQLLFSKGLLDEAICAGVQELGSQLKHYFPAKISNPNELPDSVTES